MMSKKKKTAIKWAFFGTPARAAVFLDDCEHSGLLPSLVVTTPDAPRGRGMALASPPVKKWANSRGVPLLQPETYDNEAVEKIGAVDYDVFVVIYYGKVLPPEVLAIPKRGALNIHFSLLPRWRGTSPVRAAIANGDKETGISIIQLDEKLDHGPIVALKKIPIPEPPRASDLEDLATHESAKLLVGILPSWIEGSIEAHPQNHDIATLCPHYSKEDGLLDLHGGPYANLLKIRAFNTTVGTYAFFERNGRTIRVQILDAHLEKGRLAIDTVKPEGKRAMSYAEFLHSGARIA